MNYKVIEQDRLCKLIIQKQEPILQADMDDENIYNRIHIKVNYIKYGGENIIILR